VRIIELGLTKYREAWALQKKLWQEVVEGAEEVFLILRHFPVITLGRSSHESNILVGEEILRKKGVEIFQIERGGDVTFHGPGQWMGYPILDLKRRKRDVHLYLRNLEEIIINTLKDYGLSGKRIPGMTGVWIGEKKIASIGVAISRWVTYHGFAFNIQPEKEYFNLINPCGLGKEITCLEEELHTKLEMQAVKEKIKENFQKIYS